MQARKPQRAFTLHELMVTLTILSVLSTTGIGMRQLLLTNLMTTQVNTLISHLHLARSEAIKRRHTVVLCKSRDGLTCTSASAWEQGWIVFADSNNNKQREADEIIVRVQQQLRRGVALRYGETGTYSYVAYYPSGRAAPNATFTFCGAASNVRARAIIVYWTGRARTALKNARGGPLRCEH